MKKIWLRIALCFNILTLFIIGIIVINNPPQFLLLIIIIPLQFLNLIIVRKVLDRELIMNEDNNNLFSLYIKFLKIKLQKKIIEAEKE